EPVNGIRTGLLTNLPELLADILHGDVPGAALPLAARQLHRIFQATVAGDELAYRGALGAVRTAVDRTIPARLLADPYAIGDFSGDGAADRTMRTDAFADRYCGAGGGRRTRFGLAHRGQGHAAERGETAGGDAGAAQEGTAIEAARLCGQRAGEVAAANLTVRFLDQHGRLPQVG